MQKSGVYMVRCGGFFYIGSSAELHKRWCSHLSCLGRSSHPCKKLQQAFDDVGTVSFEVLEEVELAECETRSDRFRKLLRKEGDHMLRVSNDPGFCNGHLIVDGRQRREDSRDRMNFLWSDPNGREMLMARRTATSVFEWSEEKRRKQGEAVRRAFRDKGVAVRSVIAIDNQGNEFEFKAIMDAARHLGCSPSLLGLWLSGRSPSPGMGKNKVREKHRHLIGWTFRYVENS
jgi:group I intron endonuclease